MAAKSHCGLQRDAKFCKGLADEIALPGAGMGKRQFGRIDNRSTEVNEIDVDGARAIADDTNAAEGIFNRVHSPRKVERIKRRLENRHLIEEFPSNKRRRDVNRLRLDN